MILSLKEKGETRFFAPISFSPSEKETNFATPFFSFSIRRKKRTVSHREEKKETTREPFGWFSGLSIDQSLALDLWRRKVSVFTVSESNRLPAIIKIACGVVKFQMAKL